jgi:hypothetical protein
MHCNPNTAYAEGCTAIFKNVEEGLHNEKMGDMFITVQNRGNVGFLKSMLSTMQVVNQVCWVVSFDR